jgi:hypothetical protein
MAENTKYLTISESKVYTDSLGNTFPDIFTFAIDSFTMTEVPLKYILNSVDIYRFDLLILNYYGSSSYDDLVLWINKIKHIADVVPGMTIILPSKKDMDNYYREYYR